LVSRANKSRDLDSWTNHVGPIGLFGGKANYDIDYKTLDEDGPQPFNNVAGWLGFTDMYWLTALVPQGNMSADFRRSPSGGYQADYALAPATVAPGQTVTTQTRLFAGAKERRGSTATRTRASPSFPSRLTGAGSNFSCARCSTC
jgi:YidC/Oxa1 family membrane protein insertase